MGRRPDRVSGRFLRSAGIGEFILGHLEREAVDRGLNYIYSVAPKAHPDPAWMTNWISLDGGSHECVPRHGRTLPLLRSRPLPAPLDLAGADLDRLDPEPGQAPHLLQLPGRDVGAAQ
jgi:hypothetical protein